MTKVKKNGAYVETPGVKAKKLGAYVSALEVFVKSEGVYKPTMGAAPAFSVGSLFTAGERGAWYDPSDLSTLSQDSAGTTPVTTVGQPVGRMLDKSGRGNHASQPTASSRPILRQDEVGKYYLEFDGVDDKLISPPIDFSATPQMAVVLGLRRGSTTINQVPICVGPNTYTANGVMIVAPGAAASFWYRASMRGTSIANWDVDQADAPEGVADVLSSTFDISALTSLEIVFRKNGAIVGLPNGNAGSGNFGNALAITFGSRGDGTLPFKGRVYGTIVRSGISTPEEISQMEKYLAGKSGVTL